MKSGAARSRSLHAARFPARVQSRQDCQSASLEPARRLKPAASIAVAARRHPTAWNLFKSYATRRRPASAGAKEARPRIREAVLRGQRRELLGQRLNSGLLRNARLVQAFDASRTYYGSLGFRATGGGGDVDVAVFIDGGSRIRMRAIGAGEAVDALFVPTAT